MHHPHANRASGVRTTVLVVVAMLAASCGGDSGSTEADGAGFVVQGEQSVDLDTATTTTAAATEEGAGGAAEGGDGSSAAPSFDETESTIPTNEEEDADGEFFDAVGGFMQCLSTEGYGFIGIPSRDLDETAPVNDPGYIDALTGCAASTQIVDKMEAAEDTSSLSPEEIEESNRAFGVFVDCLKGLGWIIPPLTPDENGVLRTPYIEIARSWTPPDGTSILGDGTIETDDFVDCGFSQTELS